MDIARLKVEDLSDTQIAAACQDIARLLDQQSAGPHQVNARALKRVCSASYLFVIRSPDTTICGMAILIPHATFLERLGLIEEVIVDESKRDLGVIQRLMHVVGDTARELGLNALDIVSNPSRKVANRLYQNLGYKRRETNVYRLVL